MKSQRPIYSSRILKAGALLDETKMLLSAWDESASTVDNIARFQQENILGKASRSRANDILMAFRQRYLVDERVMRSLILLVKLRRRTRAASCGVFIENNHIHLPKPLLRKIGRSFAGARERRQSCDRKAELRRLLRLHLRRSRRSKSMELISRALLRLT